MVRELKKQNHIIICLHIEWVRPCSKGTNFHVIVIVIVIVNDDCSELACNYLHTLWTSFCNELWLRWAYHMHLKRSTSMAHSLVLSIVVPYWFLQLEGRKLFDSMVVSLLNLRYFFRNFVVFFSSNELDGSVVGICI